jgi:hypothetical protein
MRPVRPLLTAALFTAAASLSAQQPLPTAESLVERYLAAIGGRSAIERAPGTWQRGRIEVPAQGITITYEVFTAPLRLRLTSEMVGLGTIRSGYDGEVAWSINPAMGPMLLEGTAALQLRQSTDPASQLHAPAYVRAMETVEAADFGGARCWKVKITAAWGEEYLEFFNAETGLLQGTIRRQATPQGDIEVTSVVREYHTVGGVRMPRVTRASMMGMEMVNTVDSADARTIPDSVFALPPEIRALRQPR